MGQTSRIQFYPPPPSAIYSPFLGAAVAGTRMIWETTYQRCQLGFLNDGVEQTTVDPAPLPLPWTVSYLLGSVGSEMRYTGSLLHQARSSLVMHRGGLGPLGQVRPWFPSQESNLSLPHFKVDS